MKDSSLRLASAVAVGSLALVPVGVWTLGFDALPWRPIAVAPVGLSVLLFLAASWLLRSDVDGRFALRVPLGALVGMGAFGAFALVVVSETRAGVGARSTLLALHFASAGGAVGVVVGLYTATLASRMRALRSREAAVQRARDEYHTLFDSIGDAVLVHDTRGAILAANDAARDRLGPVTGRPITDIEDESDRATRARVGGRFVYETVHTADDGESVPVEVSARLARYRGEPVVLSVARDVTQRRAAERGLTRAKEQLRALNRVLCHDIRNDMQIILGTARLLEERVDDDRDYLRTIITTAEHVVELTHTSRDLEQTVVGESAPALEPIPLDETLDDELRRSRDAFDDATIRVQGDLPDIDVRANELLSSVFRNLLNNAVQHSDRDDPTVVVSADLLRGNHRVCVCVADNGPGIPDDRREAVFGEGEKGIGSEGTGLGLHLVRSLVDHYGGDVWIEDNEPRGAVVVVELPVADEP